LRKQRFRRLQELGLADQRWQLPPSDSLAVPWAEEKNKPWQELRMAVYAAMVETMDSGVGGILTALQETGAAGNTLVLFLSDNGGKADRDLPMDRPEIAPGSVDTFCTTGPGWGQVMNAPFRGYKQSTLEGGIATPLIAWWPDVIKAGSTTHQVGHVVDILPTLVELADGSDSVLGKRSPPLTVDGKSLVPVFRGQARTGHERLYWAFRTERLEGNTVLDAGKGAAVRQGDWKLNRNDRSREWELYDLANDRTETKNLAANLPERVERMKQEYEAWRQRVDAP
jgi:arylsulfatase